LYTFYNSNNDDSKKYMNNEFDSLGMAICPERKFDSKTAEARTSMDLSACMGSGLGTRVAPSFN